MLSKRISKVLTSIIVALAMIASLAQGLVYAANEDTSKTVQLSRERYLENNGEITGTGKGYALNTGSNHPVFQLVSVNDSGRKTGTNFYCLNATVGNGWTNPDNAEGTSVEYDKSYDMVSQKSEIQSLVDTYKDTVNSNYYTQIMWILDNMYKSKTDLLADAGIVWGDTGGTIGEAYYYDEEKNPSSVFSQEDTDLLDNLWGNTYGRGGYFYDDNGTRVDVILTDDQVEVVEQAAIWYFTNYKAKSNSEYNCYTAEGATVPLNWLRYAVDLSASTVVYKSSLSADGNMTKKEQMVQEQAAILFNYLVDAANKAARNGYTSETIGTLDLQYTGSADESKIKELDADNYIVGPLKVVTTGNVTGLNVTPGTVTNATGTVKTLKANEEFYIKVAKSSVSGSVTISATATSTATEKKLWIKQVTNNANAEQPIVEVTPKTEPLRDEITVTPDVKLFDLALRKAIIKVTDNNGNVLSILNEAGNSAARNITADASSIPDTATYKHRKDPVVVSTGNIVTYEISIYNEGDIDGYASIIVDQLPTGLVSTLGSTVTSENGNVYNVSYDSETNKLTLTLDKTKTVTNIPAFGTTLSKDSIEVTCRVEQTAASDGTTKHYLTNIAYIAEAYDKDGNKVDQDRNNTESKPATHPTNSASDLNSTDANNYKGKSTNPSVYNDTNNTTYFEGQEDDDDFEKVVVLPKVFDLSLRKFITKISPDGDFESVSPVSPSREPVVDTTPLRNGEDTAIYNHSKEPIALNAGDYVLYTIRAYNEGDIDGYASEIKDYLPEYLDFVSALNTQDVNTEWEYDAETRVATTKTTKLLRAFDKDAENSELDYVDVQIICRVNKHAVANKKLTNIAEISEYRDTEKVRETDRDSESDDLNYPTNPETYKDEEIASGDSYIPGQEDDDDFEKVIVIERKVDLALTKFITAVSTDDKIEDGEYLTPDKNVGSKTNEYIRATVADTTGLKNGTSTNATYTEKKDIEPLVVGRNSYVLYNIRVYNEGEVDVYAGEVTDYLPENLEFVEGEFNTQYGWTAEGQTVKTTYLSSTNGVDKLLKAFDKENDDGKGSGLDYKDLPILCRVSDKTESGKKLVNTAEITKYEDEDGNELPEDIDSTPENKEEKNVENRDEDDDDYEVVMVKDFDLALRKFITNIEGKDVTTRIPQVSYENGKIKYTHPKDVLKVVVGDTVTYTLRVFNEGQIAGYAEKISDDIPEYLEYLPENETNKQYRWVMYDKEGKETSNVKDAVKIVTDYTSKANGEELMKANTSLEENPNLLDAFDPDAEISNTNPDYVDVKVAFKVKDPNSNKYVIVNKAQISEDADENGDPIDDIDSIPDKWNEGEDDQDYENVSVEYFDLSLLKYVTKTIVTENGKTKTTKTGNTGASTDITPKVEIYRKRVNSTVVKFEYTIKITNEGDIAGYAKEITDYVPQGLKFYAADNKGWKDEGNNVISTELLKDKLLQPGESATVTVILRWINGEKNLGLKTNVAEISKDENEKGIPDRDSTPDNKKPGEDDIDDAPVLLTISTGMLEHTLAYVSGALAILVVLGGGIVLIKKFVL